MSKLEVDAIEPQSGTTLTIGASGDSVTFASGANLSVDGTIKLDGNYPTGTDNVALGDTALDDGSLTGGCNTAIGSGSMTANTSGYDNTAIGRTSLTNNTTGFNNTGLGRFALGSNTTGANNTAVGRSSMASNNADNNTAVGFESLCSNTTGTSNQAFGYQSLKAVTTGDYNVGIGHRNYLTLTTGSFNTGVGDDTGICITSGSNNLLLGANAGRSNSPSGELTGSASNNVVLGNNLITNLYCADTTISSSDQRDKTDIEDFTHGLDFVTKLKPKTYKWDKRSWYVTEDSSSEKILNAVPDGSKKRDKLHVGFIAQDVLALEQEIGFANNKEDMLVVNLNEDDTAYGLKYERLVPVLVNAIKELKSQNEDLKSRIEVLENK